LKHLTEAAAKWKLEAAKPEKDRMSVRWFAELNGIPHTTFQTHITSVEGKRIKLGSGAGKKPLLDSQSKGITVDMLVRKDYNKDRVNTNAKTRAHRRRSTSTRPSLPAHVPARQAFSKR
jgi:hypothetical protein